jgi:hypothetical protein
MQLNRPSEAAESLLSMRRFADLPAHSTSYYRVETLRRQAELAILTAPADAPAMARRALGLCARNASQLQLAESHGTLANALGHRRADEAETEQHLRNAAAIYAKLGNRYQEEIVSRRLRPNQRPLNP